MNRSVSFKAHWCTRSHPIFPLQALCSGIRCSFSSVIFLFSIRSLPSAFKDIIVSLAKSLTLDWISHPLSGSLFFLLKRRFYILFLFLGSWNSGFHLQCFTETLLRMAMIPILPDPRGISQSEPIISSPWPICSCPPSGSTFLLGLGNSALALVSLFLPWKSNDRVFPFFMAGSLKTWP